MQWAREAGDIQLKYFRGSDLSLQYKQNESDVVTAADKASEQHIISKIHTHYPSHSILAEESGEESNNDEFQWIIDPLDGTTNFSQGLPLYAVSIGIKHQGKTVVGVVFAPYLNEMFHAVAGKGAYLNGKPIATSAKTILGHCVAATGFPVDKHINPDNNSDNFNRIMPLLRGVRRLGAASIDLCYTAAGFLDAYWELNLHEWDVCAGELIASEAGCIVTRFRKDRNVSILSAPHSVHSLMLPLLTH